MKKLLFISAILIFSISSCFCQFIKLPDGEYQFKAFNNETIIFVSKEDILKLIGEDNSEIYFNLVNDGTDNYYYTYKNKNNGVITRIFFIKDIYTPLIEITKDEVLLKKFFLYYQENK